MMKIKDLINKYQANCDRITAIADVCEKEQRERNEAENKEYETLVRENQMYQMRMSTLNTKVEQRDLVKDAMNAIRENVANGKQTQMQFRDMTKVADAAAGGLVPLNIQDMVDPLQEGLILDKVGIPFMTGLAGDYVWPVYDAVDATIQGEGVELADSKINLSKLTANPDRLGLAIPVTYEALTQTNGLLETIVKRVMPQALVRTINKVLFSPTKVNGATNLQGPYVDMAASATALSATPTFKELNAMKASVLAKGVDGAGLCWVMTEANKATLEGTPINEKGVYVPMIQNGLLCGVPVYCTSAITDTYIGLGDWQYQPMGLFGDIRFTVDPYSKARSNAVDFVINANYGTTTLRKEAFALGKIGG